MLKTWITGTKDFTDQGLAPSEWINDNVTIVDGGKLGKCMSFNGSTSRLSITGYELGNKWSFACWVKDDSSVTAWQMVLGLNNNGSDADIQMGLWLKSNENRLEHSYNGTHNSNIPYTPNQWNHFVGTYDGSSAKFYINGELKATNSHSGNLSRANLTIGARCTNANGAHTSIANPFKGLINDVRIWDDHCLSLMEVKELSKGLVLHYSLSRNGWGQENLIITNSMAPTSGTSGWSSAGNGWTNSNVVSAGSSNGHAIRCTYSGTTQVSGGIHHPTGVDKSTLTNGATYTLSARIRASKACIATFQNELMTVGNSVNLTTDWQIYTYSSAINNTQTYHSNVIYVRAADATQNMWIECDWIKLEEGSVATPWCPNSSDALATAMGLNDNIEYDISGFGNNGTRVGTFTYSSDTPKYQVSTKFSDGSYIKYKSPESMYQATYAFWVKSDSYTAYNMIHGPLGSPSAGTSPWLSANTESCGAWAYFGNNSPNYTRASGTISTDVWHHLVYVWDNGVARWYVDGVPSGNAVTYTTRTFIQNTAESSIGDSYTGTSWSGTPFTGQLSDFRIYATALSPEDVLSLYQASAYIDSQGNTYASSYVEG